MLYHIGSVPVHDIRGVPIRYVELAPTLDIPISDGVALVQDAVPRWRTLIVIE